MKVIWDQLIEAAITLQIFNQNITDQPSMKRQIFLVCLFYCFFRLPIYESIAAIFWQSASYVNIVGISLWSLLFNCARMKLEAVIVNLYLFYAKFLLDCFCAFSLERSLICFLSNFYHPLFDFCWLGCQTANLKVRVWTPVGSFLYG